MKIENIYEEMGYMFKKTSLLALLLVFICASTGLCSVPKPTKRIFLFYKVSDAVLMCQNSDDDMEKGKVEFEKELSNHYSKRFIVDGVKYLPEQPRLSAEEYLAMVKQNETPFILMLKLNGTGTTTATFQNMFGATKSVVLPTIKIIRNEYVVDRADHSIYGVAYGEAEYHSNAMAAGGNIYSNTDTRKTTKNGIRGYLRDYSIYQGDRINKYADMDKFNAYNDAYTGNFKKRDIELLAINSNVPYLGVYANNLVVASCTPDYPMAKSGCLVNDKIMAINGEAIADDNDFTEIMKKYKPGDNLKVTIMRNGQEKTLSVVPVARSLDIFKNNKI